VKPRRCQQLYEVCSLVLNWQFTGELAIPGGAVALALKDSHALWDGQIQLKVWGLLVKGRPMD